MSREHQFDDIIRRLYDDGWPIREIAAHIDRSKTYVDHRVGIKDPLGPLAFDPGPPPVITKRFFTSHKPGGW